MQATQFDPEANVPDGHVETQLPLLKNKFIVHEVHVLIVPEHVTHDELQATQSVPERKVPEGQVETQLLLLKYNVDVHE